MEHVDVALLGKVARGMTRVLLELAGERPFPDRHSP